MLHVERRRSLVIVVAAVAAAIAVPSVALGAGGFSGTYTTTIKSPAQLKGRWVLTFAPGGSYTVAVNGRAVAGSKYVDGEDGWARSRAGRRVHGGSGDVCLEEVG